MGEVFLARTLNSDALVAIKVLRSQKDPEQVQRFLRECEIMSRLKHPNIIPLHEYGVGEVGPYLVMPFIEGRTLDERPKLPNSVEFMLQVGDALQAIHDLRLVHRDVKPANIMVGADGSPMLIDFGVVLDADQSKLTQTGGMVGTLSYMAPELLMGKRATAAADWYAWGVTAYHLFEGTVPFITGDLMAAAHVGVLRPPLLNELRAFPGLAEGVLRCLTFDPGQRPSRCQELRDLVRESSGARVSLQERPDGFFRCLPPRLPGPRDPTANRFYRRGIECAEAGDEEGAREALKRSLGHQNHSPDAWIELGLLLTRLGRWLEGLEVLEQALKRDPLNPEALRCHGLCLERLGRGAEGVQSFRKFLEHTSSDLEVTRQEVIARIKAFEEGETLSGQTEAGALVSTFQGLIAEKGAWPIPVEKPTSMRKSEPQQAPPATHIEPEKSSPTSTKRGIGALVPDQAKPRTLPPVPGKTPRCDPPHWASSEGSEADRTYLEGVELLRVSDPGGAEEAFRKAFARDPRHLPACRELGFLLTDQNRFSEALRPLDEASSLDSEDYEVARFRGIVLERLERGEAAELAFQHFLDRVPGYAARARAHAEKRLEDLKRTRLRGDSPTGRGPTPPPSRVIEHPSVPEAPPFPWSRLLVFVGFLMVLGLSLRHLLDEGSEEYLWANRSLSVSLRFATAAQQTLEKSNPGDPMIGALQHAVRRAVGRKERRISLPHGDLRNLFVFLGERGDRESIRTLWHALDQTVEEVALEAVDAMARSDSQESVRHLQRLIRERRHSPEALEVRAALDHLSRSQHEEGRVALVYLFSQAAVERRQSAVSEVYYGRVLDAILARDPAIMRIVVREVREKREKEQSPRASQIVTALKSLEGHLFPETTSE
jgi:tetratricopeptide (TPR) repeat protein